MKGVRTMKRTNINYKEITIAIIAVALLIILLVKMGSPKIGNGFDESLENATVTVVWEEVNLRESPDGKIVGSLSKGETIKLSGKTYDFLDHPENNRLSWVELTNGTWITRSAID